MESNRFDVLTRTLTDANSSRRHTLRALGTLLLGGALGGIAEKLDLTDDASAKAKRRGKRQSDRERSHQLHAASKKHKKHKNKNKHHDKPQKPKPCGDEQFQCDDGSCISVDQCCPGEKKCPDGTCTHRCCAGENACDDGSCLPGGQCCPEEMLCPGDVCMRRELCCPGEKPCSDGSCIPENECCPDDPAPLCEECEDVVCANGEWICDAGNCGPSCGEGYCPQGMSCHHDGTCCGVPTGETDWKCVCASGYTGGAGCTANGQCCRYGCCYPNCCPAPGAS